MEQKTTKSPACSTASVSTWSLPQHQPTKFVTTPAGIYSSKKLEAETRRFAERLRRNFAREIERNAHDFKKAVLRLIRRELPPKRGRPNDPRIDAAVRMAEQGKSIKEILRSQIPDLDNMDTYGRYLAEKGLRAAIDRRLRAIAATSHP